MKNLLLSLIGLTLMMSMFVSCSNELETYPDEKIETVAELSTLDRIGSILGEYSIILPQNMDPAKASEYIASLTEQELVDKINTTKIFDFLEATNNVEALINDNPNFENLTLEDINKYAPREADQFSTYTKQGARGCTFIRQYCDGGHLYRLHECTRWVFWTYIRTTIIWNSSVCSSPCYGVNCPSGQYCSNGACINIPTPVCNPPCGFGGTCTGNNNCIYL